MRLRRAKTYSAIVGVGAIIVAGAMVGQTGSPSSVNVAGSGDSATGTTYTSPTIPGMSLNPTAMSIGQTTSTTVAATSLAIEVATPTVTPSAVAPCANNGVVLPGGCH